MKKIIFLIGSGLLLLGGYIIHIFTLSFWESKGYTQERINKLTLVAHRGGADLAPENTLTCIQKGMQAGADMIEIDIHLTKDNKLIVCHDQTIDRTTNGEGYIRELTLEEIQKFKVKDNDGNLIDEHLPTLKEVFQLINGKCKLLIEIKRTNNIYQGIEEKVLKEISQYNAKGWIVIQSFNDSVLKKIHELDPAVRLEKLIICKIPGLPLIFDGTLTTFNYSKYHYISSFNFLYRCLSKSIIKDIHNHGKEVKIWTTKDVDSTPDLPVDGIITDRPDLWKKTTVPIQ